MFGVLWPFASSTIDETGDGNKTQDVHTQNFYAINLAKVVDLQYKLVAYNLKEIFLVLMLVAVYANTTNTAEKNMNDGVFMLKNQEAASLTTACV